VNKNISGNLPIIFFKYTKQLESWFEKHYADTNGIWMRIAKKDSQEESVSYAKALDLALCYGWIDGQKQKNDDHSWLQKFTPRRPGNQWSKINTQHAEHLINAGKMQPSGLQQIENARNDGRWKAAYDSGKSSAVPDDFLKELVKNKKAKAFFDSLNKANTYAIAYRLQTAKKPETRENRMRTIIEMMKQGEKIH
jgi:uncharacterized protein YdeI (YjbR/CyaY-like superfamily)